MCSLRNLIDKIVLKNATVTLLLVLFIKVWTTLRVLCKCQTFYIQFWLNQADKQEPSAYISREESFLALDVLLVPGDTPLEHTYMYILVCDRRVRKHKKHLVTIERDEKSKFLFYSTIHMLHWDEEGGRGWRGEVGGGGIDLQCKL